ncbi:DUF4166 domain-containing protein [Frateuria soli]|uniref:DUF4166 domain-containing protein n=1 Tax=Frateuria soli TaxID=1542730 RepID=UPI001E4C51AB|nr:DUF4166 domain-containing protein [Frateuria soli]UGB37861.1 DUF4166 domain-containing protein [Frateuria soli]
MVDALFPALLGEQWHALASPVRRMHGDGPRVRATGQADVAGTTHLPARLLRRLLGLPEPGPAQAIEVLIERHPSHEAWTRRFARGQMRSRLARSGCGGRLHERLGPVTLYFELRRADDAIDWKLRGGRLLGLPLPRAWFGSVRSRCSAQAGRYTFDIDARLPLVGRLVAYRGWLEPVDD